MGTGLRRAVFAIATFAVAAACRQLVGIGDAPPTGSSGGLADSGVPEAGRDGPACGIEYAPETCGACLASSCCAQATTCSGSAACSALEGCLGPCAGEPTCRARCLQQHRAPNDPAVPDLESCIVRACASACNLTCGGVAEAADPDAAVACQTCYQSQGCAAAQECIADPRCAAALFCDLERATPPDDSCLSLLDDAGVDASTLENVSSACSGSCEFGASWSCVNHVTWLAGVSGDLTIELKVLDGVTQMVIPGVSAKVCNLSDVGCIAPTASGVTGSDGIVELVQSADAGPVLSSGYIDLSGGITPEVFFWSFPINPSPATMTVIAVTPAETSALLAYLQVTPQPGTGFVYAYGIDCFQIAGQGMTFSIAPSGSSQIFYQQGSTFSPGLTATTGVGGALIVNAPEGNLELTASVGGAGGAIGHFPLFVRDGGGAEVWALPQPQ